MTPTCQRSATAACERFIRLLGLISAVFGKSAYPRLRNRRALPAQQRCDFKDAVLRCNMLRVSLFVRSRVRPFSVLYHSKFLKLRPAVASAIARFARQRHDCAVSHRRAETQIRKIRVSSPAVSYCAGQTSTCSAICGIPVCAWAVRHTQSFAPIPITVENTGKVLAFCARAAADFEIIPEYCDLSSSAPTYDPPKCF